MKRAGSWTESEEAKKADVSTMVPDDFCRLCGLNMRQGAPSVYGHSADMFTDKKSPSIADRLALIGLSVTPETGRSNRCCSRCSSVINRLEKDMPVFRKWQEHFRDSSESIKQQEPTLSKTCPKPDLSPSPSSAGKTVTTQVTITYPSQTMTRVCDPEVDPVVKNIALRRWREAATHALKHEPLRDELKDGVIKLIRKECEALCSRKNHFLLWKCGPSDLRSFSFITLRDDLHRLAPTLLSTLNCVSNFNNYAACTAAAIAIRGRQPQLSAFSYWIGSILRNGRAKKCVFTQLSRLSITTSHNKAVKKLRQLEPSVDPFHATNTDSEASQRLEELLHSEVQSVADSSSVTRCKKEEPEEVEINMAEAGFEDTDDPDAWTPQTQRGADVGAEAESRECSETVTHRCAHTGEKPFYCAFCAKSFSSKTSLKKHVRIHTGGNAFSCSVCAKGFAEERHLSAHMLVHAGERAFSCTLCQKGFANMTTLNVHMQSHIRRRPFSFTVCFNTSIRRKMRPDTKKPFKCHTYSKRFAQKRRRTGGTPFKCSVCGKTFALKKTLNVHMMFHTGERPFRCSLCAKCFTIKAFLKGHMRTHSDERTSTR